MRWIYINLLHWHSNVFLSLDCQNSILNLNKGDTITLVGMATYAENSYGNQLLIFPLSEELYNMIINYGYTINELYTIEKGNKNSTSYQEYGKYYNSLIILSRTSHVVSSFAIMRFTIN